MIWLVYFSPFFENFEEVKNLHRKSYMIIIAQVQQREDRRHSSSSSSDLRLPFRQEGAKRNAQFFFKKSWPQPSSPPLCMILGQKRERSERKTRSEIIGRHMRLSRLLPQPPSTRSCDGEKSIVFPQSNSLEGVSYVRRAEIDKVRGRIRNSRRKKKSLRRKTNAWAQ